MRDLGGFDRVIALHNPTLTDLRQAFETAEAWTANRQNAELLFYYSGHADPLGLLLGGSRFLFQELRARVERSTAAVRVALLDACHSGEATRSNGGRPAPAFSLDALASRDLRGAAIIAASTASEFAQESSLIEGSYFTHHLLSALRGAADQDRNGAVTLAEAYRYTYAR
ncbi:MAG TPA: caspase family protein, partial [Polyangia bacterium]